MSWNIARPFKKLFGVPITERRLPSRLHYLKATHFIHRNNLQISWRVFLQPAGHVRRSFIEDGKLALHFDRKFAEMSWRRITNTKLTLLPSEAPAPVRSFKFARDKLLAYGIFRLGLHTGTSAEE